MANKGKIMKKILLLLLIIMPLPLYSQSKEESTSPVMNEITLTPISAFFRDVEKTNKLKLLYNRSINDQYAMGVGFSIINEDKNRKNTFNYQQGFRYYYIKSFHESNSYISLSLTENYEYNAINKVFTNLECGYQFNIFKGFLMGFSFEEQIQIYSKKKSKYTINNFNEIFSINLYTGIMF
jgi:hypothetical protein